MLHTFCQDYLLADLNFAFTAFDWDDQAGHENSDGSAILLVLATSAF